MEIRHTIEILVKDIQDIEKLVASLQNSPGWPAIEMDLALSKLRNVYEVLSMIRDDRHHIASDPVPAVAQPAEDRQAGTPPPPPPAEARPSVKTAPEPVEITPPPAAGMDRVITPVEETPVTGTTVDGRMDSGKIAAILAEKFSREASINENMATQRSSAVDSRLAGKPIDNIARNIGINDRFMIIRELFGGNSEDYSRLIRNLDEAGSLDRAMDLIRGQFAATMQHEGVVTLVSLARRRFVQT